MQNECNNGLSLYQPLPSLSWHSSLPFFGFGSQSLYSSKLGDRSNRQTFGISCEEMWWSTKIKLAVQPSRFGWNAHRLHLKMDDMTAPQKLGPRHLHHPPVDWPSHDVVTPNQIFQDGRLTILCRGMHSHCPRHLVTRIFIVSLLANRHKFWIHVQKNVPAMFKSVPPAGSGACVQKVVLWIFSCPAIITTLPAK